MPERKGCMRRGKIRNTFNDTIVLSKLPPIVMKMSQMMSPSCVPLVLLHPLPFSLLMSAVQASASLLTNPNVILL